MKKLVGHVSEDERDYMRVLHGRKYALIELSRLLTKDSCEMYEKILSDLADTSLKSQEWWNKMSQKYQWEGADNCGWQIDFDNCGIYLIDKKY